MSQSHFTSTMARVRLLMAEELWIDAYERIMPLEQSARRDAGLPDNARADKDLAAVLDLKVEVCRKIGRDVEAERAFEERTRLVLKLLRSRGKSLIDLQKHSDAEKAFREALGICERCYGKTHAETATCMDNLATCLRCQSRFVEAVGLCEQALEIRLAVYGEAHGHTAASFSNLGHLYRILNQTAKAEPLLVKSLIVREKVYGPEHTYVAESLDRIASLHRDQGRFDEAIKYGQRCTRIRHAKLGPDHPLTAAAEHNLALSLERRSGDTALPEKNTGYEASAGEIAVASPRGRHGVGSWIAAALVIGGSVVAVCVTIFTFPTWVVRISVAVAIVLGVLGAVGVLEMIGFVSLERLIMNFLGWLRRRKADSTTVDRDATVLGRAAADGVTEIAGPSVTGLLKVEDARQLVMLGKDPLDLFFVHSLTQAAADVIAKHKGTLRLNGLREMRSKLAKSLRWHEGRLELDGVPELTEAAAAHIARHAGDLSLGGIRELFRPVAQHLAHHRGTLELNGVRSIDEQAAEWIIKHRGAVQLRACRLISPRTQRILRANPHIEFPDVGSNGMM